MQLSIVIPLLNEEESLKELHEWIVQVMNAHEFTYEIIFIDDGSRDNSWPIITHLANQHPEVKAIQFTKNFGKSQALAAGFKLTQGEVIITMDADLQDNPEEIPELYHMIVNQKYQLVSGWKKKRYDSILFKNFPSKIFNAAARLVSGLKLHDFNCGLKAYHKDVVKTIKLSGEMHRYIPVLAKNEGFTKISEKVVKHQARKYGHTKFGAERFVNGFLDLLTIWFFSKFGRRPMHLFGAFGTLMFLVGFISAFWIGASKLYKVYNQLPSILVVDNPWFYIALTAMLIGVQLFIAGFIGELILKNNQHKSTYTIKDQLN